MKKVAFYTLGCKVNQYETNAMIEQFINKGYEIVSFGDISDIYVINTCTVTNMSDRKSRQIIRRAKEKNKDAIVVVTRMLCTSSKTRIRGYKRNRYNIGKYREKRYFKYSYKLSEKYSYEWQC